jgi:phospholipase C
MQNGITRRELLQAGAGAGALALGASPLVQQALAKSSPGKLTDIEHVVVLIQENRSFDHYFGTLAGVRGFADPGAKSVYEQPGYPAEGYNGVLLPFHISGAVPLGDRCFPDITHQWVPQHQSWDGGAMDGFVRAHLAFDGEEAGPATMAYYEREDIPFYFALAEAFTICDNYHCSVMGPTHPNRLYSLTATIDPEGNNGGPLVETLGPPKFQEFAGRFTWPTMPEQLSASGVSWKVYTGADGGLYDNVLSFFHNYQTDPELKAKGLEPVYPDDFVADIANDELPEVCWINAALNETEHPGYSTAKVGEFVVESLLRRLKSHDLWGSTALFLTWDENGGFFDHVAPPFPEPGTKGEYLTKPDVTNDDGEITGPIGLGFRVPLLVMSPFTRGGFLCSETFDHTSILQFLEKRFGAEVPNLSEWRRENTGDLTSAFNFAKADKHGATLPKIKLTKEELEVGGCEVADPVTVPPNSDPEEGAREWKTPSGP